MRRLCAKARQPLAPHIVAGLGIGDMGLTTGAVCVYPTMVAHAVRFRGTGIPVASVATGFPAGLMPCTCGLREIRYAVDQGADEIDIVITREHVLTGNWQALYDEVAAMRQACGAAHLKAILATGDLQTLRNVYAASMVAMQAGADFIKTSTGKGVNATLPVSLVMVRALRDYRDATGQPRLQTGGRHEIAKDALNWQFLMREEMGRDWLSPQLFRLGASSMLGDIERSWNITSPGGMPRPAAGAGIGERHEQDQGNSGQHGLRPRPRGQQHRPRLAVAIRTVSAISSTAPSPGLRTLLR